MTILITDNVHPIMREILEREGHSVHIDTDVTYDSLLERVNDYDAIVVRSKINIDRDFLSHARHLKCIGRVGAGMETIDVDYAESLGIRCLNSPEGNRDAVGEHALGLLLALFDKIAAADMEVRKGLWRREANRGLEVKGKKIGIIGFGNMGGAFAKRLAGFECEVLVYDILGEKASGFGMHLPYVRNVALKTLQQEADVVSLHVPLTDTTHYLANESFFESFAKPFYLINTSRGAVVHTAQLVAEMEQGKVLGAALDVLEYENMSKDGLDLENIPADFRYLLQSPRTVLSPHVAGWTVESKYKLAAVLADKMIAVLNGANV